MKHLRLALLHLACVGPNALAALILAFVMVMWGQQTHVIKGVAFVELDPDSWLARGPYKMWGGTTFGPHGVMVNYAQLGVADHELVHTEQMQAEAVQNIVLTALMSLTTGFGTATLICVLWWVLSPLTALTAANLTALLRGEKGYLGSHFEEGARAHDHEEHKEPNGR